MLSGSRGNVLLGKVLVCPAPMCICTPKNIRYLMPSQVKVLVCPTPMCIRMHKNIRYLMPSQVKVLVCPAPMCIRMHKNIRYLVPSPFPNVFAENGSHKVSKIA